MTVKTILVPMEGSNVSKEVLETAWVVANRFGAHIDALHVLPYPSASEPFVFDYLPDKLRETAAAAVEKDAKEKAAVVRGVFDEFCKSHNVKIAERPITEDGPTAAWREETGYVSEVLVNNGRLSDMIAMPRPWSSPTKVRRSPAGDILEAVILGAGRPILLIPPNWTARRCEHAAFAWNESIEASRALAMAMPWLVQMNAVTVLTTKRREGSVKVLLDYLAWHGVKAEIQYLENKGDSSKEAILNVCSEVGAEFLVVGGFSRARARELLFGGVTRHLFTHSNIITVMTH